MKLYGTNYTLLAILVWSAAFLLFILSWRMGSFVVEAHTVIPPPSGGITSSTNIIITPLISVPSYQHIPSSDNLRDFIKSYNITDVNIINQIVKAINEESKHFNIPSDVLAALVAVESSFDHTAVSKKKAVGLSQINSKIWLSELKEVGIVKSKKELTHPAKSIKAGAYVLRKYLDEAKEKGVKKPMMYALAKYNGTKSNKYYRDVMEKKRELQSG